MTLTSNIPVTEKEEFRSLTALLRMDADGLPLVGPGVDYTKVEAIQQKRTIAFLNHFINHTVRFLNRFSCVCEEKLEHMANRIQQLEITMNLLETKLSSIPGLESVTAPTSSQADANAGTQQPATQTAATPQAAAQPQGAPAAPQPTPEESPPPVEEVASNPVSKDPRYAKYFKMVQVGVPEHAVKMKMANEGLDASLLDTPDAPAPPMEETKKDSDSDDFDDSDDASSMSD